MKNLYAKKRVNFGKVVADDLPRYEYHRTARQGVEISATSNSYQEVRGGLVYQWDNIAPEIALVILQDALKNGVDIKKEVATELGEKEYTDAVLKAALNTLNSNPDYTLFTKKLALSISNQKSEQLTLETLTAAGISTVEQFDKKFTELLLQSHKLSKNYPNFAKIRNTDDYNQFLDFLAHNPIYNKFLQSLTERIAYEYNKGRLQGEHITPPKEINRVSLATFLKEVSYSAVLKPPSEPLQKNTLYVEFGPSNELKYTVLSPSGKTITDTIPLHKLNFKIDTQNAEEQLKKHLASILAITSLKGHTGDIAVESTESLKSKGQSYLSGNVNHDLFLSYLPAFDMVKDEEYKLTLYKWLEKPANMSKLKDQLVNGACRLALSELEKHVAHAKSTPGIKEDLKKEMDKVATIMGEIIQLISELDYDPNARDTELDKKIADLKNNLKTIKQNYRDTINLEQQITSTSARNNFNKFVKEILFNNSSDKSTQFISAEDDPSKTLSINHTTLIDLFLRDKKHVLAKERKTNEVLWDKNNTLISPDVALRELLKTTVTKQLKNNIHHYHSLQSYKNDNLNMQKAPVGFRGGNLTDSLTETKPFAKKFTRHGEYSADCHLLVGQENNLRKHEVRSGAAATLIAATGVDGTRSVTDKFNIALDFGGQKDVKIMYILRGKEAFHTQEFLDPFGKNKLSEIAYTHVTPNDYVMTILYNKNNVILDVIPGNLSGEIEGVSNFSREVINACLNFYNQKHDPHVTSKQEIKLPDPNNQKNIPTSHLHKPKELIDILHRHHTGSQSQTIKPETELGAIRIDRVKLDKSHKKLVMQTLRPETTLAPFPGKLTQVAPLLKKSLNSENERENARHYYDLRHVLTLKDFPLWNKSERKLHEEFNRILQPGFMEGDIQTNLKNAEIAGVEWLTDALVPTLQTSFLLHVAASLITDYEVDIEQVNEFAQKICGDSAFQSDSAFEELKKEWQQARDKINTPNSKDYEECTKKAQATMARLYPNINKNEYDDKFKSCLEIEKNKTLKHLSNKIMSEFVDKHMPTLALKEGLSKKPVFPLEDNHDLVFLGPAASGKSTISNQYVSKKEKPKYVSLATDDYRGIHMPNTNAFEKKETPQVFIRTQDSAFLISELVEERMKSKKVERPNVIVDGVTYKNSHRQLIEQNKNSILVCACIDDVAKVVKRCYDRATNEAAGSADKGRHVNTTSLLEMHKTASINLLKYCPNNTIINLYNTDVPPNVKPPFIATVKTSNEEKSLTIHHEKGSLQAISSFFNKSRLNSLADHNDGLFIKKIKGPAFQIDSLFAIMGHGFKIVLNGQENKPCISIKKEGDKIVMSILDPEEVKRKLQENSTDKELLKMMLLYGDKGSLKAVQETCLLHNDTDTLLLQYLDNKASELQLETDPNLKCGNW